MDMLLNNRVATFGTVLTLITTSTAGKVTNPSRIPKNAVLLSKVSTLTLRSGALTSARRIDAVRQLECIGPKEVCQLYNVDTMRCVNEGADYEAENIQWSCKASLPKEFKLGSTDVICEGYESSDDPYVLKGSCGVEYRLLLTDEGEEKFGMIYQQQRQGSESNGWPRYVFFALFLGVLFVILKGMWASWNGSPPSRGGARPPRSNGNGNGGNDDDPPPPYDDGPPPYYSHPRKPKSQSATANSAARGNSSRTTSSSQSAAPRQQRGWRPGFWSGTAAGAAAGYLLNNRGQTRSETRQTEGPPPQPETQQRSGGFFSTFTAPQQQRSQTLRSSSSPQSGSSGAGASYSSTRHESTGFGSTRRR